MRTASFALSACLLAVCVLRPAPSARAESWSAAPLDVHEWGVQVFDRAGEPTAASLPAWFHRSASGASAASAPTRNLPPDNGMRELPVLHFYSAGGLSMPIPVGIEVGFAQGAASAWYPQVNGLRSARAARSARSRQSRARLVRRRTERANRPFDGSFGSVPRDPTRQLFWDRLELSPAPEGTPHASSTAWVDEARALPALWVSNGQEHERFVFYEGQTRERMPLRFTRGAQYTSGRRHLILHNDGQHDVHDVFVTHRDRGGVYVWFVPGVPAGRSAGAILEQHRVRPAELDARTSGAFRQRLVDPAQPAPPTRASPVGDYTMMRDPAMPAEDAEGHRLYGAEVDLILSVWGDAFFREEGTTVLYREDLEYVAQQMPLSIYTDMYNYVRLRRASLALWRNAQLP